MVHVVMAYTLVVVEHMLSMIVEVAVPEKLQIGAFAAQMPLGTFSIVWKFRDLMCCQGLVRIYLFLSP